MVDLGTLGGESSTARDINDSGQVVGSSYTDGGPQYPQHPFLWSHSTGMVDLGTLGGTSAWAAAINDGGQVVGTSRLPGDTVSRPFLWSQSTGMIDLGTLGGSESGAKGINDSGQVTGWSYLARGGIHAFLWSPSTGMVDLGALGGNDSYADGINDMGQVVGYSYLDAGPYCHAFLWNPALDSDGDGVPDAKDQCPSSILPPTVIIGSCDTGVPNLLSSTGCTISDLIAQAASSARNHGQFVSAVANITSELMKGGSISGIQKGAIQNCAAKAKIP